MTPIIVDPIEVADASCEQRLSADLGDDLGWGEWG